QDVARNMRDHRDGPAGDIDAVDRALVEVPGDDRVAGAEIRILANPARAQHAAVAHFEQASLEVIGHGIPPARERWSAAAGRAGTTAGRGSSLRRRAGGATTQYCVPAAAQRRPEASRTDSGCARSRAIAHTPRAGPMASGANA